MQERISRLEKITKHKFSNRDLPESALTHPCAAEGKPVSASYERLEFLGDSILGAMVATDMFERFPQMDEGRLTRLKIAMVSGKTLSDCAEHLGISELIYFGDPNRPVPSKTLFSASENVFEAVVGALYLDGGFDVCHDFVMSSLSGYIDPDMAELPVSPKGYLQEVTQRDLQVMPVYKVTQQTGPAHDPTFEVVCFVKGIRRGRGKGSSKKAAEVAAATDALENMGYFEKSNDPYSEQ